jgi:hypothetical protein
LTNERAPRRNVAATLPSALFALVVAAWIHPALAATGTHARCDQSIDSPPIAISDDERLSLQVIGHSANTAAATHNMSPAKPPGPEPAVAPGESAVNARIAALLRRTARETHWGRPQPEQSEDQGIPLVADSAESTEEPPRMLDSGQPEAAAERAGYPDDDLVRDLQRQMYRTDI